MNCMGLTCGLHVGPMDTTSCHVGPIEFVKKSLTRQNFGFVGSDGEDEREYELEELSWSKKSKKNIIRV